ncbi:hypothetical protein YC2023_035931 [Brassica napus]
MFFFYALRQLLLLGYFCAKSQDLPPKKDRAGVRRRRPTVRSLTVSIIIEVVEVEDVLERLPERLFATDRFPGERVNMYLTVDRLLGVTDVFDGTQIGDALNGTPEMAKLMAICRTNDGDLWEQRRKGGGDAVDPLFVYSEKAKTNKMKHKGDGGEEPVVKQQMMSGQGFGCPSVLTLMVCME